MKTISEHILDIVQNSVRAKATLIEIIVDEDKKNDIYTLIIRDNGCGMDEQTLQQATEPFFTSRNTRKVGMGLSLLKQNAEQCGGKLELKSKEGVGTEIKAVFQLSNIDRPPLGDVWNSYYLTLLSYRKVELKYTHKTAKSIFEISSDDIIKMLDGMPLTNKEIKNGIIELIKNNLTDIKAS
ncbi:ATP-binding protein [Maribellus comscasis]|uniref:histidine kinase n=1 Tax=Maribellus comscasis TaxID=2681766 RepID=A0A6I6JRM2_9BACT|nr:ATP-binding protein [Maribellus comscasis]QGY45675.1 ATP-binding protein [Maribellus comscasis]